jgi:hypothetical protein
MRSRQVDTRRGDNRKKHNPSTHVSLVALYPKRTRVDSQTLPPYEPQCRRPGNSAHIELGSKGLPLRVRLERDCANRKWRWRSAFGEAPWELLG